MGLFKSKELEQARAEIVRLKNSCRSLTAERDKLSAEVQSLRNRIAELEKPAEKPVVETERTFNGITLTKEQSTTFELLENTDKNYFVTGKAGTGKSTVLNYFRTHTKKKGVAVVSLTGSAALNVDGQTIHSLFRMDLEPQDTKSKSKVSTAPMVLDTLKAINVLIIDEISMVRADIMDMIDARLRLAKEKDIPYGGCQVIAFGDLYQLPPIATDRVEKEFIVNRYGTLFFFGAPAVKQTFKIVELVEVLRQKDNEFVKLLNNVRDGRISEQDVKYLNEHCGRNVPDDCLRVVLTKDAAKTINMEKLAQINSKEYFYETELGGDSPPNKEDMPFDFELRLKVGARVMMTRNDTAMKYINGSIGTVTKLTKDSVGVQIAGKKYDIEQSVWTKKIYHKVGGELVSEVVGWAKQYPIRLAYAITVHKSQGQTYDNVVIDYSGKKAFAAGQTYVALSRCRTLSGIYLTRPLTLQDIYADKEVLEYMGIKPVQKPVSTRMTGDRRLPAWLEDAENLPF